MGKFARGVAHVKNVTVDPVVGGGKYVGRKTKAVACVIKAKAHDAAEAVRTEEHHIEVQKEARKVAKAQAEDLAEALITKKVKAQPGTARPAKQGKSKATAEATAEA